MKPLTWQSPPLDPSIWRNLPLEVLCNVIDNCDKPTLVSWSCTSQSFYTFASNKLWETLSIGPEDIVSFYGRSRPLSKFERQHQLKLCRSNHMVEFLTGNAFRQRSTRSTVGFPPIGDQTPELPTSRARVLRFDLNGHYPNSADCLSCFEEFITGLMKKLLPLLPRLRAYHFEGNLRRETWSLLMKVRHMRSLTIRTEADYVLPCWGVERTTRGWASDQVLDMQQLTGLTHLTSLSIGRLSPKEAEGLAHAVVNLKLSTLSIRASPPARTTRDPYSKFAGDCSHSPIFLFLRTVMQASSLLASRGTTAPLSHSLSTVFLEDLFRQENYQGPSINNDILIHTLQLWQLTDLDICVTHPHIQQSFFFHAEFPALKHFTTAGCRHLFCDEDWSRLGIHIPETEHNKEEAVYSSLVSFKPFLMRHRRTISSMTIYHTCFTPPFYCGNELRFGRAQLDGFWDSTPGSILESAVINAGRWQRGHWMVCCDAGTYCCARNERFDLSISDLQWMHGPMNNAHS